MKVKTETEHELTPKYLANALANSDPTEFAAFWFHFNDVCKPEQLDDFARVMATDLGGNRKKPLKELNTLITYYEVHLNKTK